MAFCWWFCGVIPGPSQDAKRGLHQKTNVRFTRLEAEVRAGKVANLSDTWILWILFGGKKNQTQIANPLNQTYTYIYWLVNQFPVFQCDTHGEILMFRYFSKVFQVEQATKPCIQILWDRKKDGQIQGI